MKNLFKLLFFFMGLGLFATSCSNTAKVDTDDNGVVETMPVDSSASGDTAVVVDTVM